MSTQTTTDRSDNHGASGRWLWRFVRRFWRYIAGHDEYRNGEHIAHEPSIIQRMAARRERMRTMKSLRERALDAIATSPNVKDEPRA